MLRIFFLTFFSSVTSQLNGRIVGGEVTEIEKFPYQLALLHDKKIVCGAVLIRPNLGLTVAHCTEQFQPNTLQVRAGSSYHSSEGQLVPISKVTPHPQYNSTTFDYDISVLELANLVLLKVAQVIPVAPKDLQLIPGEKITISGWGYTSEDGMLTNQLRWTQVQVIDQLTCSWDYLDVEPITSRMFCASQLAQDACQGDSGGPATLQGLLVGLVSLGFGCATPNRPGIYTFLPQLRDFIDEFISD